MPPASVVALPAVLSGAIEAVARRALRDVRPLRIYLFGSRAAGVARHYSDYDIALASDRRIEARLLIEAKELFEELPLFQRVDVVDLADTPEPFRASVESGGLLLYERSR